jgi:DNA-binding NtrC family response regulator
VYGETGTGKEMFAHALHYCSPRKAGPFVPVNCGALPEHLLENELFGHARGAYTDAGSNERGLLAVAEGGTLFLDEADGLSLRAQVKLLRFLQNREYRPLGSTRNLVADVRIVAAANQDLRKLVETGQMREDLYHRLNILRIQIPPLRERPDDVFLLADHFLARYRVQYRRPLLKWSPAALSALSQYDWPGNIRELEGVVLRAVVLAAENTIEPPDLDLPDVTEPAADALSSFHQAKTNAIQRFERAYLTDLLARFAGNVSRAAEAAGKERRSFQRLLQKHGVTRAGLFGNRANSA